MKLGISGQALGEVMSFADIVKLGKKYGVTEYEIWPCNAGADWDYREGSLDDVKKTARDEGVHICCVTLGAGFSAEAAADPGRYAEYLLHAVDAAAELGAPVVNHYCGAVNPAHNRISTCWSSTGVRRWSVPGSWESSWRWKTRLMTAPPRRRKCAGSWSISTTPISKRILTR